MEMKESSAAIMPCDRGEHNFMPIGDPQKREDNATITVGTTAFCTKCSNSVFVTVASQSKITTPPPTLKP